MVKRWREKIQWFDYLPNASKQSKPPDCLAREDDSQTSALSYNDEVDLQQEAGAAVLACPMCQNSLSQMIPRASVLMPNCNFIMHCIYVDDMEHILLHSKTQNKQLME